MQLTHSTLVSRMTGIRVTAALAMMVLSGLVHGGQDLLAPHRWAHRVLLVFAPDRSDTRLRALADTLARADCDVRDRDLISGELVAAGDSRLAGRRVPAQAASALRRRFDVAAGDFVVVLIGKDGGEKLRAAEPSLQEIFALIDGMPMRRAEIVQRGRTCDAE